MRATSGPGGHSDVCAADIVAALSRDPVGAKALAQLVEHQLVTDGQFAQAVMQAVEAAHAKGRVSAPGRLLAGTVSSATGAIQPAGGGAPATAYVLLGQAATPVTCVVPSHILPDLTPGAEVWVEPVNGSQRDLLIVAIRAFTGTPLASTAVQRAGDTMTGALTLPSVPALAAGHQQSGHVDCGMYCSGANQNPTGGVTYPVQCTNTPTGITLSAYAGSPTNSNAPTVEHIDKTGFDIFIASLATGNTFWHGTFTTVGN